MISGSSQLVIVAYFVSYITINRLVLSCHWQHGDKRHWRGFVERGWLDRVIAIGAMFLFIANMRKLERRSDEEKKNQTERQSSCICTFIIEQEHPQKYMYSVIIVVISHTRLSSLRQTKQKNKKTTRNKSNLSSIDVIYVSCSSAVNNKNDK